MLEQVVDAGLVGAIGERDRARRVARLGDAPAQMVERAAAGDREQPGPQAAALRVEAVGALPGLEEDLLLDVLGRGTVAEHALQRAEDRASVEVVEGAQRLGVAARQAAREAPLFTISGSHGPLHLAACAMSLLRSARHGGCLNRSARRARRGERQRQPSSEDSLKRTLMVAAAATLALAVAPTAQAAHDPLASGTTTLKLDAAVAKALSGAGVRVAAVAPARAGVLPDHRRDAGRAPRAARSSTPAGCASRPAASR